MGASVSAQLLDGAQYWPRWRPSMPRESPHLRTRVGGGWIPPVDVRELCQMSPGPRATREFWGSQRSCYPHGATAAHQVQPPGVASGDSSLKEPNRHSNQAGRSGRIHVRTRKKLRAPADFSGVGPSGKIKLLSPAHVLPKCANRFAEDITQDNLLNHVRVSLPGIASAFLR